MTTANNYFSNGYIEINGLKKQYKKLAFELHPHRGGSNAEFQEMAKMGVLSTPAVVVDGEIKWIDVDKTKDFGELTIGVTDAVAVHG